MYSISPTAVRVNSKTDSLAILSINTEAGSFEVVPLQMTVRIGVATRWYGDLAVLSATAVRPPCSTSAFQIAVHPESATPGATILDSRLRSILPSLHTDRVTIASLFGRLYAVRPIGADLERGLLVPGSRVELSGGRF